MAVEENIFVSFFFSTSITHLILAVLAIILIALINFIELCDEPLHNALIATEVMASVTLVIAGIVLISFVLEFAYNFKTNSHFPPHFLQALCSVACFTGYLVAVILLFVSECFAESFVFETIQGVATLKMVLLACSGAWNVWQALKHSRVSAQTS